MQNKELKTQNPELARGVLMSRSVLKVVVPIIVLLVGVAAAVLIFPSAATAAPRTFSSGSRT